MRNEPPIYETVQRQLGCFALIIGTYGFAMRAVDYDADRCHLPVGHRGWHDNFRGTTWTP